MDANQQMEFEPNEPLSRESTVTERLQSSRPKRILALDGGEIRGALCLGILEKIEELLKKRYNNPEFRLSDYYDMIGGTSTGAIIASGLAKGMRVIEVSSLYLEMCGEIFAERLNTFGQLIQTIFSKTRFKVNKLEAALAEEFKTGLCIIAKRADTFSSYIFHNHPESTFYNHNSGILVRDLLRATSAAPSSFMVKKLNIARSELGAFIDGGVDSLILFYLCTLRHLPYQWSTGKDSENTTRCPQTCNI